MAIVGEATLNIIPKVVGGLQNAINSEIDKANLSGAGKSAGSAFSGGFASGANFAVWSKVASVAIDAVSDSIGSAASRVDTLNNYPRIMESLGVESNEAQTSIQTMSDALSNVPTRLDDMASTVSGLYAATEKYGTGIDTVTDAGLALNSMLLAGGQNQAIVNAAMEQFRQMVAKGKPDMQDWRSLLSAAPGQMNQLAEAILGAGASVEDLYAVLGGGKEDEYGGPFEWGSLSMGEFVEKFAELKDRFADDAEDAQGGIQTAFANMQNAVTRGVAGVLDAFGQDKIAGAINDVKKGINAVFGKDDTEGIRSFVAEVAPAISGVWDQMVEGVSSLSAKVGPPLQNLVTTIGEVVAQLLPSVGEIVGGVAEGVASFASAVMPIASTVLPVVADVVSAIAEPVAAIAPAVPIFLGLKSATEGLGSVAKLASGGLADIAGMAANVGLDSLAEGFLGAAGGAESFAGVLAGPLGIALVGGVAAIGAYAAKHWEAAEETKQFYATVRSVGDIAETAGEQLTIGAQAVTDFGDNASRTRPDIEGLEQSISDYLGAISRIQDDASGQIGLLGQYKTVIDEMAGQGEVSAGDMAKLEWALEGIEQATGQAYDANVVLKGSYEDESGAIHNVRDEIDKLIASRQEELRMDALKDMYTETYKLQAEAALELTRAEAEYAQAHDQWIANFIAAGGDAALAEQKWQEADEAREESMSSNLSKAANAYHTVTDELGQIEAMMGQAAEATENVNNKLFDWINANPLASSSLNDLKVDVGEFSQSLEDAGIKAEDLADMGELDFMRLVNACNGDIDQVIAKIDEYKAVQVGAKTGKITIDYSTLKDANGELYTFNTQRQLVDKNGKVVVEKKELTDAQGNVVEWNGTELQSKSATVTTDNGGLPNLISDAQTFINLPSNDSKHYTVTTDNVTNNYVNNITTNSTHAAGGHIEPRHAGGFIAAGPLHTNFGLVGEDGVEAVWQNDDGSTDVYPLNNPRYLGYAKPLAESIAASLAGVLGKGGDTYVINGMSVPAESELAAYMRSTFRAAIREGRA